MSHETVNYHDIDAVGGGLHFLRDPLGCEQLGVSVLEVEPGWSGKPHDHADEGQEEVYVLVSGAAEVDVGDDTVAMEAGDAVRIDPEETRRIRNGDAESTFVLAGAP